jgi:hypothetical protein
MNRISVHVEPIPGTGLVRVLSFNNETLDDVEFVRHIDASLLEGTYLPAEHQAASAVALTWLFDEWDVVSVVIYDTSHDEWEAYVSLFVQDESSTGRGVAASPADAIRAAKWDAYHKAAP